MPAILTGDDPALEAAAKTYQANKARLSTPGPVGVPQWEAPDYGGFDFSMLLQPPQQTAYQPIQMGLKDIRSLPFRKEPEPQANTFSLDQLLGKPGGKSSGGMGPGAYGWSGSTGGAGTKGTGKYGLQAPFWAALQAANAAMQAAGLGGFGITDGWRSYDAQVSLKKKKPTLAATPGRSVHGLGLAADLKFTSAQAKWMQQNAQKFGLMVPMPGKEPWHIQYQPSLWKGWS